MTFSFGSLTARYVRLTATRLAVRSDGIFAMALCQMQVLSGSTNFALGTQVDARDSIESGGWGKTKLVDGRNYPSAGNSSVVAQSTYLRKEFTIDGSVSRATLYATGLGAYEVRLNGQRVGDHLRAYTICFQIGAAVKPAGDGGNQGEPPVRKRSER